MNLKSKQLNRSNNKLDKNLFPEYVPVMVDMVCYLRASHLSEYHQEIVRQDLLEMLLSAQERGDSIESVIGNDYKTFCDEIIASLPARTVPQRICGALSTFFQCAAILSVIGVLFSKDTYRIIRTAFTNQPVDFLISVPISSVISFALIIAFSAFIVQSICKTVFQTEKKRLGFGKAFLIGVGIMAFFLLIAWYGQAIAFTVSIWSACIAILVMFALYLFFERFEG
ncbi:hypothetical protein [Clostridium merdae]|uniref:hypothetical protein n=1 Tax=Clostridium merdae TaxID=1958780 RepID=UPI000A26FCEA|nr:hypothetical protein [Clostridium merdae]